MADSSSQERDVDNEVAPDPALVAELKRIVLECGNELLTTGDSTEELLDKLDGLEHLLLHLPQGCKSVVEESLEPAKKALISNELLRHAEEDVRITVTSCISEIIRITAPDEPYGEDQMKDYFRLANAAYQKLPSMDGRAFSKAVSILQTISYCQICIMMLDFELHDMVREMFNLFLNGIQSSHPQAVFSSMGHIMILIIQNEDSDEFSVELAKILLATLKKGNQNVSPLAFRLAKNVFENCANDLEDYLPEAVRCMGADVKEYDDVVVSSFRDATQREMDAEETRMDVSLENNLIDNLKNDENVNENYGTVLHSCDQTNQQESVSQDAKETRLVASSHGEVDLSRDVPIQSKRIRKPHSIIKPEEGYDPVWVWTQSRNISSKGVTDFVEVSSRRCQTKVILP